MREMSLSEINPLIEGGEWNTDTAANVAGALAWIADASERMQTVTKEQAYGLRCLLHCCASAINQTNEITKEAA